MPYSQFTTLQSVREKLQLTIRFDTLFEDFPPFEPSIWLTETLTRFTKHRTAYFNEKSRSEGIVFPILSELQYQYQYRKVVIFFQ